MRPSLLIGALLGALLLDRPASACSVCYCGDPTLLPLGTQQPEPGKLRLSLDGRFLRKEAGEAPSSPAPRHLIGGGFEAHEEARLTLTGALSLGDASFALALPWLSKELTSMQGARVEQEAASGPGDLELYGRYNLFLSPRLAPRRHVLGLAAGLKLPTAPLARAADGAPLDLHAQPGSGSVDPVLGASYTYDADPFSLYSSLLLRYPGPGFGGSRYGATLLGNLAARYRAGDHLLLGAELNARYAAQDLLEGAPDPNSGGFMLFAAPQLVLRPAGSLTLRAQVQLPVAAALFGEQREYPVAQLGMSYDL